MRRYKIRQISTGLFFYYFSYQRPFRKNGRNRKTTGPGILIACFSKDVDVSCIEHLNSYVRLAIFHQVENFFVDTEIIAYEYQPIRTTMKMKTVQNRWEQKIIMEKLKAQ